MTDLTVMTEDIINSLRRRGQNPRPEVRTAAGVADIVTDKAVYEIIPELTDDAVLAAIDRVVAHRDAIDPNLRAVIFGLRGHELDSALIAAERVGVSVNVWSENSHPGTN